MTLVAKIENRINGSRRFQMSRESLDRNARPYKTSGLVAFQAPTGEVILKWWEPHIEYVMSNWILPDVAQELQPQFRVEILEDRNGLKFLRVTESEQ